MKITCPKCQATYKVDLPDPGEAGIDVQCGKCLYVFLFSTGTEKSAKPDSSKGLSPEPIVPPQKDEDQELSGPENQPQQTPQPASSSPEEDPETVEELELEPIVDDPEPVEIVVEDEGPEESLEEVALDDIWNQAMQEGARTTSESKDVSPPPPSEKPAEESGKEESREQTTSPPEKKSKPLLSLEDRQKEIDRMIADHQAMQKASIDKTPAENPPAPASQPAPQKEKGQEELDLDEEVVINEEEAIPNWEEAFHDQSQVEEGWKKAQEQDRIHEEQQLEDALGKKVPGEDVSEDQQSIVDAIFAETQGSEHSQKETVEPPETESPADPKQQEINEIFAEAREDVDPVKSGGAGEAEDMPSWEEAFADQSEVESGWKKAQEKDRLHEEQQLADALGEEYDPAESSDEKASTATTAQDSGEPQEPKFQEENLDGSTEKPPSPETQEKVVGQHTIPGEIDLMSDLDDLNMKELVSQAFKEESETEEKSKSATPETVEDEISQEAELTMEPASESLQEVEPQSEDIIPKLEMESEPATESEETLEPSEVASQEEIEEETIPELTLESAAEEPEENKIHELESLLDTAETPEEVEALIAEIPDNAETEPELTLESTGEEPESIETLFDEKEPEAEPLAETAEAEETEEEEVALEMESEPELVIEAEEKTETPATTSGPKTLLEQEEEEIWNNLLAGHDDLEPPEEKEASAAPAQAESDSPVVENDFWDQVLEKDSEEPPTAESDEQTVTSAPATPDTAEREALTDEELWKQAFPGDEDFEPAASKTFDGEEEEVSQSEPPPLVIGATAQAEGAEDSLDYEEAAYADYDDDDDEFEFERRKRKLGPFVIPHGRRGDMVIGGAMLVFLLLAGSVYFTLQTFAPGELTEMETAKTEVPEGLTPREVPLDELAGDLITSKPEKTPPPDKPGDSGEAILSDPADILKESPQEKGILKDLAESQILKDTGKTQTAKIDESAIQALTGHSVTLSTIMPVAYDPTDIRVLSFSVEIQLSNAQSAKRVRESLPVYEDLMTQTVEDFLRRKFYNDILYVKEKLQKRLQTAMNQSIKNGRVRKAKFTDYAIQ